MPLSLRYVPPAQGGRWLRDGFRLFARHPLPFSFLFVVFLAAVLVSALLPLLGGFVMLCAVPLLSLGFMIAAESALGGGPIHPGQYLSTLRGDPRRRQAQLVLCLLFGAATLAVLWLAHAVDDGSFAKLQKLMAEDAPREQVEEVLADPGLQTGMLLRFGLAGVLAVPFWHAPALVHWGGQGPAQALFSSTLALWRSKGAFAVYFLSWFGLILVFGMVVGVTLELMGARQLIGVVAMPALMIFSTVFYVSLIFMFSDSFGGTALRQPTPESTA